VVTVAVGLLGAPALAGSGSPLADGIAVTGFPLAVPAITIGALVATSGVLLTSVLGVSRVMYAMAKNGDLPSFLGRVSPTRGVPHYAILIAGGMMALLAATNDLSLVVNISNVSALFYYALSNASAVRLKAGRRNSAVSAAGVALCLFLLLFLTPQSIILTLGIMCAGRGYLLLRRLTGKG